MNESTRVVKLLILAIVGLLFGAFCVMTLFNIETGQNHEVVKHYGDVLRESGEVKAALAAQGVKEYNIYNGRRLASHHIQFVTDRPVADQDAIRKLCKDYLMAHEPLNLGRPHTDPNRKCAIHPQSLQPSESHRDLLPPLQRMPST